MELQLSTLPLNSMNIRLFAAYIGEVRDFVKDADPTALGIKTWYDAFESASDNVPEYLATIRKSKDAQLILDAETNRDNAYKGLYSIVDGNALIKDMPNYASAQRALAFLEHYGRTLWYAPDNEESSQLLSMLKAIENDAALKQDFTAMGCKPVIEKIELYNNTFMSLMKDRAGEDSDKSGKFISSHRKAIIKTYRKLEAAINLFASDTTNAAFNTLVGKINARISYYSKAMSSPENEVPAEASAN